MEPFRLSPGWIAYIEAYRAAAQAGASPFACVQAGLEAAVKVAPDEVAFGTIWGETIIVSKLQEGM